MSTYPSPEETPILVNLHRVITLLRSKLFSRPSGQNWIVFHHSLCFTITNPKILHQEIQLFDLFRVRKAMLIG